MAEWATKRFWKSAAAVPGDGGFAVLLDDRPVRTPARCALVVPTQALAAAIAQEWQAQGDRIVPDRMPLTRRANSALDKVAPQRAAVETMIADYAATDLLCYRAAGQETLSARQAELWDPVLDWAAETFDARLTTTVGVMPVEQAPRALTRLRDLMRPMSDFDIAAFHDLVSLSGSYLLGLAASRGFMPAERVWALSRLDEDWQAGLWGTDEEAAETTAIRRDAFLQALRFMRLANQS